MLGLGLARIARVLSPTMRHARAETSLTHPGPNMTEQPHPAPNLEPEFSLGSCTDDPDDPTSNPVPRFQIPPPEHSSCTPGLYHDWLLICPEAAELGLVLQGGRGGWL